MYLLPMIATVLGAPSAASPEAVDNEVVVEGRRDQSSAIQEFVDSLTEIPNQPEAAGASRQLVRFATPICPGVIGLDQRRRDMVVKRMRDVAAAAEMQLAKANCQINALVALTADKQEMREALLRKHPLYHGGGCGSPVSKPSPEEGGAMVWHVAQTFDESGRKACGTVNGQASMLSPVTRHRFVAGVLIIEFNAAVGLTMTQLADYASMRLYANARPERLNGKTSPTILGALGAPVGSPVPLTLTQWDMGFLKGLYGMEEGLYVNHAKGQLRRSLRKYLLDTRTKSPPGSGPQPPRA